ncbi:MAG: HAMP domain-containing histidine kinase [Planctomycetes bacterium]|nr:HAMP domain-containing histidine kinase [Planctomycetota bacterium]
MRTRTRLLIGFVAVHLVLTVLMGVIAWNWLDRSMRSQAEESARSVGRVLAQGGFPLTDEVMAKMRALTGYEFRVLSALSPLRPGTVQVAEAGKVVEVDYRSQAYLAASRAVFIGTLTMIIAGSAAFWLVAWWLAGQFARPVERLAGAARRIGEGDLERTVELVGSGELRSLAHELEQMRRRLNELDRQHRQDERLATLGTFTATIAHEVRNPLSAVRLTVQLLAKRMGGDAGVQMIMEELERLDLIVDELLAFSKGMHVTLQTCALRMVAEDVARLLRRQAEHAGVALVLSGEATVSADPARLRQLLMNLLLNAIQAVQSHATGEEAGRVTITITTDGFSVSDNGPGVAPDLAARLFEPFTTNRAAGTGLGLHLAKAIAEAHGAVIRLDQEHRPGARFVLSGLAPASG